MGGFDTQQNAGKFADSRRQLAGTPPSVNSLSGGRLSDGAASKLSSNAGIVATLAPRPAAKMLLAEYEVTPHASREVFKKLLLDHGIELPLAKCRH